MLEGKGIAEGKGSILEEVGEKGNICSSKTTSLETEMF